MSFNLSKKLKLFQVLPVKINTHLYIHQVVIVSVHDFRKIKSDIKYFNVDVLVKRKQLHAALKKASPL